ncbi:MAG: HAD-IC family P-type ATPase [Candidatus Dojkabacteria bacterium]|nr:HAD-IC family P-type ATPase [Candidatus Dojkabacteria bacterium]
MKFNDIKGLSREEASRRKSIGLSNKRIDSYSATYLTIIKRNILSPVNIVLIPLVLLLGYFKLYAETSIFGIYIVLTAVINSNEEIRIKRRLESLLEEFKKTARVIRDNEVEEISVDEIVKGDYILGSEGDGIITDGKIIYSKYLQLDESALTGESHYIERGLGDNVLSGSYIITGEVVYQVDKVGKDNYLNQLGEQSTSYKKNKSKLESLGEKFIVFFVTTSILSALIHYFLTKDSGYSNPEILKSVTAIVTVVIPQTLIFLISLSFVISITKLSNRGVLIQKRGAVDDLAGVDVLCIDKTGTITTNKMTVENATTFNLDLNELGKLYKAVSSYIQGRNKTSESLEEFFINYENLEDITEDDIKQIPFTSKNKFSAFYIGEKVDKTVVIGAGSRLVKSVDESIYSSEVVKEVKKLEKKGLRVLIAVMFDKEDEFNRLKEGFETKAKSEKVAVFGIKEKLNPGIKKVIKQLYSQGIEIKVISGDSLASVEKISREVGIDTSNAVDLLENNSSIQDLVNSGTTIFTRATPEDKYAIVESIKKPGKRVAMVGDGINDVLGMKSATVSISMQSGARIAKDVSDIVLLDNDYKKIPEIFYEGDNLVFNLKLNTMIYFSRAILMLVLVAFFSAQGEILPIHPTSVLLFSFIGTTFPSYSISFSRQNVTDQRNYVSETILSGGLSGILMGLLSLLAYILIKTEGISYGEQSTFLINVLLTLTLIYSFGISYYSKKLTSKVSMVALFFFGTIFGYFQGTMPFYLYLDKPKMAIFLFVLPIVTAIFIYIWLKKLQLEGKFERFTVLIPALLVVLALIFPSRSYYQTDPFDIKYYWIIFLVDILFVLGFIVIHKIVDILLSSEKELKLQINK